MAPKRTLGHQRGSSMVSQCLYALSRHCSMKSGSFFLAEICRMVPSFKPRGTVSVSTSVTKPYLYSRFASSWIVLVAVVIAFLNRFSLNSYLAQWRQRDEVGRRLQHRL